MTMVPARSAAYALFSELVTSPFFGNGEARLEVPDDLPEALEGIRKQLPYPIDLSPLARAGDALSAEDGERLAKTWSGLFEVGDEGPAVPLREELVRGQESKTKEEVVRFYEFFGYRLGDAVQWAPDQLPVLLEFVHYLIFCEGAAQEDEAVMAFQRAQRDFTERHLLSWIGPVRRGVGERTEEPYLRALFDALDDFLRRDFAWQQRNLAPEV